MCNTFWLIIGLSVLLFSPISVNVINFLQAAINLFDTRVSPRSKIVFKFHDLNKTVTPPIFSIPHLSTNPQNSYELLSLCKLCLDHEIGARLPQMASKHDIFFSKKSFLRQCVTYFVYIIDLSMLHFSPISVNVLSFLQTDINLFDTKVSFMSKIFFKFHYLNKTVTLPILSKSQLSKNPQT